ncbi:AEC family transporter [Azoarcus sp. KH32C]|uniref:AEC family transporter n=1 Tax=Azoarcus sp. KH32C TaxID=748247 RepID=UPI0002385DF9|nr:AEC family transporter [Azoarcus sp. KH32C]BAL27172.1 auxin efflux carrier [Azoarcus sp. KH32C]
MQQILQVTFPFFALVLCGYLAARRRLLPLEAIPGLNTFVLFFALPCMLFRFGAGTPIARLLDLNAFIVYVVCALAMVGLTVISTRKGAIGWNDASFGALVAAFPNSGFMGMPLLVSLLGARAAGPVMVPLAVDMVITSSLCIALSRLSTADGGGARQAAVKALKSVMVNPLPWAIMLGGLSSATGFLPYKPLMRVIEMLADAGSPTALFTIGAVLARSQAAVKAPHPQRRGIGDVPLVVLYKLIVHPALIFGVGTLAIALGLPLDPFTLTVLVLVAALPSASNVPMLTERFGADTGRVARVVLVTTACAFLTFSGAVAVLVR